MRLHYSPNSPYARKVVVALAETGQTNDVEIVEASTGPLNAQAMPATVNPLGKIPALERADGAALYDSRVICRYVDSRAGGVLYPAAPRLWDTLIIEATADGIMDAALLMVYESRVRPEDKRFDGWLEGQWSKVTRALDVLESRWMPHLNGPIDMGAIAVGCALGYLDLRHDARGWRATRPALAAWVADFSARPSMVASQPPG